MKALGGTYSAVHAARRWEAQHGTKWWRNRGPTCWVGRRNWLAQTLKGLARAGRMAASPVAGHQLRYWKRPKTIYRELKALGLRKMWPNKVAGNCHRWWRNSKRDIKTVLTIAYFDRLGSAKTVPDLKLSNRQWCWTAYRVVWQGSRLRWLPLCRCAQHGHLLGCKSPPQADQDERREAQLHEVTERGKKRGT